MSVIVSCRCGQQFKTHDRHAGKRVPCPGCGQVMTVPAAPLAPPASSGGVRAQCGCGWSNSLPREYEGKTVRCPSCQGAVLVPDHDPLGIGPLASGFDSLPAAPLHLANQADST